MKHFSEIHIFQINLLESAHDLDNIALLDLQEVKRLKQFKQEAHRHRFIKAHTGLRKILMKYTIENPVILKSEKGKPFLKDFPQLQFNLSHSENVALCAVALQTSLGIDIEYIKKKSAGAHQKIAERFFSKKEINRLNSSYRSKKLFLKLWTKKEACLKASGETLWSCGRRKKIWLDYKLYYFMPCKNYAAALAVEKSGSHKKRVFFTL